MLSGRLSRGIVAIVVSLAMLAAIGSKSASATEPHENPETAVSEFSGVSLLKYYADALYFVLQKNSSEVTARLDKMPFANILPSLESPADDIRVSGIDISSQVMVIDENVGMVRTLVGQSRLLEASNLAAETFSVLSQAYTNSGDIERATETTGQELNVFSSPENSSLRQAYNGLLERIDEIRQLLDFYKRLLSSFFLNTSAKPDEQAAIIDKAMRENNSEELFDLLIAGKPLPTNITFDIKPRAAFVGDNISFDGSLTSEDGPLADRNIEILLNGSTRISTRTDVRGHYEGILQIPYQYVDGMDFQALYYPQDKDTGVYLASLSDVVRLKVLFYEATLNIAMPEKSYPGLATNITGTFDYGNDPPLDERQVEIYLDNNLIFDRNEQALFTHQINLLPDIEPGGHNLTAAAAAAARYAPVVATGVFKVIQATPVADIELPGFVLAPGNIKISGSLKSEMGPLNNASIEFRLGQVQAGTTSLSNGNFSGELKTKIGPGLVGRQDLTVRILPKEPWNAGLVITKDLIVVNWINCGGLVILLVLLGVFLPGILRRKLGVPADQAATQVQLVQPAAGEAKNTSGANPAFSGEPVSDEPAGRILYWYRLSVRFLMAMTKALLKPQHTLREFAGEVGSLLGARSKHFTDLTLLAEKSIYSKQKPTGVDADESKKLADELQEELKG